MPHPYRMDASANTPAFQSPPKNLRAEGRSWLHMSEKFSWKACLSASGRDECGAYTLPKTYSRPPSVIGSIMIRPEAQYKGVHRRFQNICATEGASKIPHEPPSMSVNSSMRTILCDSSAGVCNSDKNATSHLPVRAESTRLAHFNLESPRRVLAPCKFAVTLIKIEPKPASRLCMMADASVSWSDP